MHMFCGSRPARHTTDGVAHPSPPAPRSRRSARSSEQVLRQRSDQPRAPFARASFPLQPPPCLPPLHQCPPRGGAMTLPNAVRSHRTQGTFGLRSSLSRERDRPSALATLLPQKTPGTAGVGSEKNRPPPARGRDASRVRRVSLWDLASLRSLWRRAVSPSRNSPIAVRPLR